MVTLVTRTSSHMPALQVAMRRLSGASTAAGQRVARFQTARAERVLASDPFVAFVRQG